MHFCKITVLKTMNNQDLAEEYRREDIHQGPCPFFNVGDEFVVKMISDKPEDFPCGWAWDDIHKLVMTMMLEGDFSPWMKDGDTFITCCTDGIKPVVFKLERMAVDLSLLS